MERIDKTKAASLNKELQAAIRAVAERHGMALRSCKLAYDATFVRIHAEIAGVGEDGTVLDTEAATYDRLAGMFGLADVARGTAVRLPDGHHYVVTGMRSRAKTAPVIIAREGKTYCVPAALVARAVRESRAGTGGIQ